MGNIDSGDKDRDMTIPSHLHATFKKSSYVDAGYASSSKDDDRYGQCDYLEAAYDRHIIKKRLKIKDDRQYQLFLKNREQRMAFDGSCFVKLLDFDCGPMPEELNENDTYKYYIDSYLDHHANDLKAEIANRRSAGDHFSVPEMQRLMDMFIKAGTALNECGSRHGDLRPEFVIIDESGRPLLLENLRDKTGTGGRVAFVADSDLYLSPVLFKCYCRNIIKIKHDKSKDDVFSAGMILLEAGILESVQGCYDRDIGKVNVEVLNSLIEKFQQQYSGQLSQRLKSMLAYDETDRCSFKEIGAMSGANVQMKAPTSNTGYSNTGYGGYQSPQQPSYNLAPQSPQYMQGGYSPQVYSPMPPTRFGNPQPQQSPVYGSQQQQPPVYGYNNGQQQGGNRSNPLAGRLGNY